MIAYVNGAAGFVTLEEDLTLAPKTVNSGTKDGLCHSELWVDFIKATGIKKASNNRGQESTPPPASFCKASYTH
jgi:hypothetical protein